MSDQPKYVRLRGLPYSSKEQDIRSFLGDDCAVASVSLPMNHEGRPSGEGFVGLKTEGDVEKALAKNKELIAKRYIEVFRISHDELTNALRRAFISEEGRLIKLRGLPFSASPKDIKDFMADVEVEEVVFGRNEEGRPSGEAFVRLASKDDVQAALQKNKQHMGKRYVEVYESKPDEINRARGVVPPRPGPPNLLRDLPPGPPFPLMNGPPMGGPMGGPPMGGPMGGPPMHFPPMPRMDMDARSPRGMWDGGGMAPPPYRMDMEPRMDRTFPQKPSRIVDYDEYEGAARGGPIRAPPPSMGMYSRAAPYDPPPRPLGGGGGVGGGEEEWSSPTKILMRGLPFDVSPMAIEQFFHPLRCYEIKLGMTEDRRPSGDGSVEFGTISEAREALKRDKHTIGSRYIELYPGHDVPPSIRRIRFRRVGGAPSIPPAPLSTPSHRSMPAAPIPTGRPPVPPPRFEPPMMNQGGGGGPPRGPPRGYESEMGGGYGSPAARGPPREGGPPASARNGGAYSSFPSREYNGGPPEYRESQGAQGRPSQESYAPPSYASYEAKPEKRSEQYDEGYGRGGGGYGGYGDAPSQNQRTADPYGGPPQRTADPYGASPQRGANPYGGPPRRPAPVHNGGGDYSGYEGYGGGGGQYGAGNAGGYY